MRSSVLLAMAAVIGALDVLPASGQSLVLSLEELRRELAAGDVITVVSTTDETVSGRLMRFGDAALELRRSDRQPRLPGPRDVTIALRTIQQIDRPRDSSRNGAVIGAGIGAGFGGAMFLHALAIDRNELDEWAASYVAVGAISTAVGALIGWAIDAAKSKPDVRYRAPAEKSGADR